MGLCGPPSSAHASVGSPFDIDWHWNLISNYFPHPHATLASTELKGCCNTCGGRSRDALPVAAAPSSEATMRLS
jgi:hypothetical protein